MTLEKIKQVKDELARFDERLNNYENRLRNDSFAAYGCNESGALKRSALDLKSCLTEKITNHGLTKL